MPALYLFAIILICAVCDGCSTVPTQARALSATEAADSFRRADILEKYEGTEAADALRKETRRLMMK